MVLQQDLLEGPDDQMDLPRGELAGLAARVTGLVPWKPLRAGYHVVLRRHPRCGKAGDSRHSASNFS
jgi:hypothetical protein